MLLGFGADSMGGHVMKRLKKISAVMVALAAFGAVLTSSAFATATTTDVQWYYGASPGTLLSGSETLAVALAGSEARFGAFAGGNTYEFHATGINCFNCVISNAGSTAIGSGEFEFTGVTVDEPHGCTTASSFRTKPLSFQADWMMGTVDEFRLEPTNPTTLWTVTFSGCAAATTLNYKGNQFLECTNLTKVQAVEQEVHSSAAINKAAGGSLTVGSEPASLTADLKFKMSGTHAGQAFGTH